MKNDGTRCSPSIAKHLSISSHNLRPGPLKWSKSSRSIAAELSSEPNDVLSAQDHRGASNNGISLGLRDNWGQFWLLVLVNAFVGGMVGLERTVVPLVGTEEFKIGSALVVFTFIIAFGVVKAVSNFASGMLADRFTRKSVLVAGWAIGLPVPFLLAWGPTWTWIVVANVLLGLS